MLSYSDFSHQQNLQGKLKMQISYKRKSISMLAIALVFSSSEPTISAELFMIPEMNDLYILGPLEANDYSMFIDFLGKTDVKTLGVAGPGGSLQVAFEIGQIVRERNISTKVIQNRDCASACSLLFMAGTQRSMGEGARIGVHLPFIDFENSETTIQSYCSGFHSSKDDLVQQQLFPITSLGRVNEDCLTSTYQLAFGDALRILNWIEDSNIDGAVYRNMISTRPSDMTWYNSREARALNLTTSN